MQIATAKFRALPPLFHHFLDFYCEVVERKQCKHVKGRVTGWWIVQTNKKRACVTKIKQHPFHGWFFVAIFVPPLSQATARRVVFFGGAGRVQNNYGSETIIITVILK